MKDKALRLALEFLESGNFVYPRSLSTAIKEALAQPAPVQEIDAVYGYCPTCGAKGVSRERHPDGSDICTSGHTYKSKDALATPQQQKQKWAPLTDAERRSYQKGHDAGVAHHKQAIGERNFCHRCGKRLKGVLGQPQVHTCTPPLWGHK